MLPVGTESLVLADGTQINPISGGVVQDETFVEVPNTAEIKREITASRKRIADLPVPPAQMNTLSVIISYTLFGLNDEESDLSDVRGLFVQKSRTAADKMFALMDSESETTRMVASKDVLDRAGQRPIDIIEHRHKMEGGLTIHYVEKKDNIPTIDMEDF